MLAKVWLSSQSITNEGAGVGDHQRIVLSAFGIIRLYRQFFLILLASMASSYTGKTVFDVFKEPISDEGGGMIDAIREQKTM